MLYLQLISTIKLADRNKNMKYISVGTFAEKYGISERTVRNYCATGKIEGTFLTGKTWNIPEDAVLAAYQAIFPFVDSIYTCLWFFNAPFNLMKGIVITLITFLIYKHISPLIKGKKTK